MLRMYTSNVYNITIGFPDRLSIEIISECSLLLGRIDLNLYTRRRRRMPHLDLHYREINESESIPYVYNIDTFSMKIILLFQ